MKVSSQSQKARRQKEWFYYGVTAIGLVVILYLVYLINHYDFAGR